MRTIRCSSHLLGVGVCPGGCLPRRGVSAQEGGVYLGAVCPGGVCQTPPLWTEWQTPVKTLRYKLKSYQRLTKKKKPVKVVDFIWLPETGLAALTVYLQWVVLSITQQRYLSYCEDFTWRFWLMTCNFSKLLPPANEVCEGYVFTPVCQSFCSQGGSTWVGTPWAGTPPPWQVYP